MFLTISITESQSTRILAKRQTADLYKASFQFGTTCQVYSIKQAAQALPVSHSTSSFPLAVFFFILSLWSQLEVTFIYFCPTVCSHLLFQLLCSMEMKICFLSWASYPPFESSSQMLLFGLHVLRSPSPGVHSTGLSHIQDQKASIRSVSRVTLLSPGSSLLSLHPLVLQEVSVHLQFTQQQQFIWVLYVKVILQSYRNIYAQV